MGKAPKPAKGKPMPFGGKPNPFANKGKPKPGAKGKPMKGC